MKSFLRQIADIYALNEADSIDDYLFIFPNKRSSTFFSHYLNEHPQIQEDNVHTATIGAFVAYLSDNTAAQRIDQLFILYNEYRKLAHTREMDFDRFSFWGNMILDDFNDVDRYLVAPDKLFDNLKKLKTINSNYLTDDQIEVIRRYWKDDVSVPTVDSLWKHIKTDGQNKLGEKFMLLWNVLTELYFNFHQQLESHKLTTSGNQYRNAAYLLKTSDDKLEKKLRRKRYVFIGFGVLSTSEYVIFNKLKQRGIADFYWDINHPLFNTEFNAVIRFIRRNQQLFPSRYQIDSSGSDNAPNIEITGIPGNVAQVDYVSDRLRTWLNQNIIKNPENATDTAVILPDESLFIPLLYNIPQEIENINITMGLSMRDNPLSALMRSVSVLQQRSSLRQGIYRFYYEDVISVISFAPIRNISPDQCDKLRKTINDKRLFHLSEEQIEELAPALSEIFVTVKNKTDIYEVINYLRNITLLISSNTEPDDKIAQSYLKSYNDKLDEIDAGCETFGIDMKGTTLFRMVDRAISNDRIHFFGEPLRGLQIMGVNETRALDFDNLIIMSVNEGVLPKKNYSMSFIPDFLRVAYGLPSSSFQEQVLAYLFYRLISRAKNVELLYDARVGGLKTGEFSRYIAQLLYLYDEDKIKHKMMSYDIQTSFLPLLDIEKTPDILAKLEQFKSTASKENKKFLSASSLNTYINCQLEFYLRYVEGYDSQSEMQDFIDAGTYGTILHNVVQDFYNSFREDQSEDTPVIISAEDLRRHLDPANPLIDKLITRNVNFYYNKLGHDSDEPLTGEAYITGGIIKEMILNMIRREIDLTPITFRAAEKKIEDTFRVNDNLSVNIRQFIDRIDSITDAEGNSVDRIVDYKTGSDELKAPSITDLFIHDDKSYKAIMQLLFYCLIYSQKEKVDYRIQPVIYKMLEIGRDGIKNLKIGKEDLLDYRDFKDEYRQNLQQLIEEIFNPEVSFKASPDETACKFCAFKAICRRESL
ncbi:MAG: PD-(D/E)XK nuclease family protein [Paramuribaculum sp.]|nr:PD-(D/E)XK nuclease family protein [Paramuribaculum sp.]